MKGTVTVGWTRVLFLLSMAGHLELLREVIRYYYGE